MNPRASDNRPVVSVMVLVWLCRPVRFRLTGLPVLGKHLDLIIGIAWVALLPKTFEEYEMRWL